MDWGFIFDNALSAAVGQDAVVYALIAIGLNVHFGFTGLLNFGQVGFAAVGAYGVAISVTYFDAPLWVGMLVGLGAAVVLALLLGLPTLRLRADYLAIVTIAASEIIRLVLRSVTFGDVTGGSSGLTQFARQFYTINPYSPGVYSMEVVGTGGITVVAVLRVLLALALVAAVVAQVTGRWSPDRAGGPQGSAGFNRGHALMVFVAVVLVVGLGPVSFNDRRIWVLTVGWGLVALSSLMVFLLMRSPWGRVVKSIREDEDAARSLGKNVYFYKMQSLVLGGLFGALGGIILAVGTQSVQPDNFSPPVTFFAYAALILGGTARVFGPVVGAMIFWALLSFSDNVLRQAVANDVIPTSIMSGTQVGQVRFMLVGIGLILLMAFRPQGIFGDRREIDLDAR